MRASRQLLVLSTPTLNWDLFLVPAAGGEARNHAPKQRYGEVHGWLARWLK